MWFCLLLMHFAVCLLESCLLQTCVLEFYATANFRVSNSIVLFTWVINFVRFSFYVLSFGESCSLVGTVLVRARQARRRSSESVQFEIVHVGRHRFIIGLNFKRDRFGLIFFQKSPKILQIFRYFLEFVAIQKQFQTFFKIFWISEILSKKSDFTKFSGISWINSHCSVLGN